MKPNISYDDPVFQALEAKLDESLKEIKDSIPYNPVISSEDEWNSSEYDYENFVAEQEDSE